MLNDNVKKYLVEISDIDRRREEKRREFKYKKSQMKEKFNNEMNEIINNIKSISNHKVIKNPGINMGTIIDTREKAIFYDKEFGIRNASISFDFSQIENNIELIKRIQEKFKNSRIIGSGLLFNF